MKPRCPMPDCWHLVKLHVLCSKHAQRFVKYGDARVTLVPRLTEPKRAHRSLEGRS